MRVETVKCDQCGAIKGEGNHWLAVDVAPATASFPLRIELCDGHYLELSEGYERHDLCGQDCFHKHLDALLFTKPKQTSD